MGGEAPARGYTANKEAVRKRLRRIEGQVRGVERMVEEDRYCKAPAAPLSAGSLPAGVAHS